MIVTTPNIQKGVKLADHCRFGVGGPADFFVEVRSPEEIREAIGYARQNKLNYFIYGSGSNLFFDDRGFRGLVIRITGGEFKLLSDGLVLVDAGYELPKLVRDLAHLGWGGLEFLGNIPGSVGGAIVGNAGCYGKSMADVLQVARVYFVSQNRMDVLKPQDFEFNYRHSKIKYDPDKIVLNVTLKTVRRPPNKVIAEIEQELGERKAKHPHTAKCAGSFFKNPEAMPAWKAIQEASLHAFCIGGACLSDKHANFLINRGNAASKDILNLAREIQTIVKNKLNIKLEPEVRYIGEHGLEDI